MSGKGTDQDPESPKAEGHPPPYTRPTGVIVFIMYGSALHTFDR
jgi:hypothetical protein